MSVLASAWVVQEGCCIDGDHRIVGVFLNESLAQACVEEESWNRRWTRFEINVPYSEEY